MASTTRTDASTRSVPNNPLPLRGNASLPVTRSSTEGIPRIAPIIARICFQAVNSSQDSRIPRTYRLPSKCFWEDVSRGHPIRWVEIRSQCAVYHKSCSWAATFAELTARFARLYCANAGTAGLDEPLIFMQGAPQRCSFVVGPAS